MNRTKEQWIRLLKGQIDSVENGFLTVKQSEKAIRAITE